MKNRESGKWKWIFGLYLLILFRLLVLKYSFHELEQILAGWKPDAVYEGAREGNLVLFRTIRMYIDYYGQLNSFENLFGNILVFIPVGIFYPLAFRGRYSKWFFLPVVLGITIGIELTQLISLLGKFDVDDILLNCFGAVAGFIFFVAIRKIIWYYIHKNENTNNIDG